MKTLIISAIGAAAAIAFFWAINTLADWLIAYASWVVPVVAIAVVPVVVAFVVVSMMRASK